VEPHSSGPSSPWRKILLLQPKNGDQRLHPHPPYDDLVLPLSVSDTLSHNDRDGGEVSRLWWWLASRDMHPQRLRLWCCQLARRGLFLTSKALMFEGMVGVYVNRDLLTVLFQMTGDVLVKLWTGIYWLDYSKWLVMFWLSCKKNGSARLKTSLSRFVFIHSRSSSISFLCCSVTFSWPTAHNTFLRQSTQ